MNTIPTLIAQIQGLCSSAGDISRLQTILEQSEESLHSESTRLLPALDQLDPSIHSLGYLYFFSPSLSQSTLLHPMLNWQIATAQGKFRSWRPMFRKTEKFGSDNNFGLVKQVVSSMYKRNIQRLTQTYLTLSLQDIANTVQLNNVKEAEMLVLQMIQDGEIYAKINQKDGMVRFLEDPEEYKTCEMIERIDSSIKRIMTLAKKLTAMDEQISCDSLYLAKVGRKRQRYDFDDFDSVPQKFFI